MAAAMAMAVEMVMAVGIINILSYSINELNVTLSAKQDPEIIISLDDVDKALSKIKARKASGPDNICGMLLKSCR